MDEETNNKNFSHQDERLKINTSFEEAIKILVQPDIKQEQRKIQEEKKKK
jgi:hypothetical protein